MTVHHNWNQMLLIWSVSNCFSLLLLTQEPCAIMPPLELFMEVSYDERRAMLYRDLERGDVVVGRINNIREYGFFLTLLCTAMGLKRDIEDLELSVGSPDAFVFIIHTSTMSGLFPFLKSSFNFWRKKKVWCCCIYVMYEKKSIPPSLPGNIGFYWQCSNCSWPSICIYICIIYISSWGCKTVLQPKQTKQEVAAEMMLSAQTCFLLI